MRTFGFLEIDIRLSFSTRSTEQTRLPLLIWIPIEFKAQKTESVFQSGLEAAEAQCTSFILGHLVMPYRAKIDSQTTVWMRLLVCQIVSPLIFPLRTYPNLASLIIQMPLDIPKAIYTTNVIEQRYSQDNQEKKTFSDGWLGKESDIFSDSTSI